MTAAELARKLGGRSIGNGNFLCRCPVQGHGKGLGDRHPSLSIADGDRRLLLRCFAGCDISLIRAALGCGSPKNNEWRYRPQSRLRPVAIDPRASDIWTKSIPATSTVVERHLREVRGISLAVPANLRCGPGLTMVAAVRDLNEILIAVQTTRLTKNGEKAPIDTPRRTIGALQSGAVHLGHVDQSLGLAEGTEKALAAMQLTGIAGVWSCLGAHRMHQVSLPSKVRELHIFADADDTGRAAAARTAEANRCRRVVIHYPTSSTSANHRLHTSACSSPRFGCCSVPLRLCRIHVLQWRSG